jgi:hypothetical protein
MKISFPLLVAALACTVPQLASAIPVNATFNGTVSGAGGLFDTVLNDFPVGTAASFEVTFDDARLVDDAAQISGYDVGPVSGWLRLGSLEWLFNAGSISTYTYLLGPGNPVVSYGLHLTGAGPTISDNGSIFGLFLTLTPDATPFAGRAPLAGFAYPFPGGEYYSYADLAGVFRTSNETSVPAPGAGLLMLSAVALLAIRRRAAQLADGHRLRFNADRSARTRAVMSIRSALNLPHD